MSDEQSTADVTHQAFDAGRQLRALRRARVLSQRELAAAARVNPSVVAEIESGRRRPGVAQFDRIVRAAGFRLNVVDAANPPGDHAVVAVLEPDDVHDGVRDRAGRRFPAHLEWEGRPEYQLGVRWWWGWHRIARNSDELVPDHVYWHRPRHSRGPIREHPWFGEFRSRTGCFGPAERPCLSCAGTCRFGPGAAEADEGGRVPQSRPSEGPPEVPPA